MRFSHRVIAAAVSALVFIAASVQGSVITSADILNVPKGAVGSGNGTLDFILLTESAGGSQNASGGFNGDNANTAMPTGNGNTTANESFITSFGELRDFFALNFPNGSGGSTVNELVIMVDVNETGGPQTINLDTLDIWLNAGVTPAAETRNNPLANDIVSAKQNATKATFAGGTKLASLDAAKVLGQLEVGAGFPDHAIFTGINPFNPTFADTDRFLLHWTSSDHDNGGESVFLSGKIGPQDIAVPEPSAAAALLLLAGCVALLRRHGAMSPLHS